MDGGEPTGALVFRRELFADTIDEARPLLDQHWREIALNQDTIALDPDYSRYAAIECEGKLRVFIARRAGKMVGYAVYIVDFHLHYRAVKWALCDIFWTHPSVRATPAIIWLLRFVDKELNKEGPLMTHAHVKEGHPHAGLVLEKLGYRLIERGYAKRLPGAA